MRKAVVLLSALGCGALAAQSAPPAPAAVPVYYDTATVYARPLDSATASVTVLDRAALDGAQATTVADVLRFVPGLDVTASGRGGLATAQIRGGDPNFTLVLLDGVPQNDPTYQVGDVFDLSGLPASSVERIEVVRGPLSAFYGSTGLAGAINIITREAKPGLVGGPVAQGEAQGGSGSRRLVDGTASGGWAGGGSYTVGGAWEEESHEIARESFREASGFGRLLLPLAIGKLRLSGRYAAWDADDYPDASGGPRFGSGLLRLSTHREGSLGGELLAGDPERPERLTAAFYRHDLDRDSPAVP
ncbi:MAG TPA: TonB-dependent receptor plug domain-containing protein, partial [Thermoanaerobaculia bacterium]